MPEGGKEGKASGQLHRADFCYLFLYSEGLMRIIVILVGGIAAAIAGWFLGGYSAKAALANTGSVYDTFEMTKSGWLFSDKIGSADAPPIERARVALGGPLGLSASEVIYFIATIDRDGDTLTSSCTYRMTGPALDTRWWSLTLYDFETQNYVPNDLRRSSFNNHNVPRADDESWQILVSPTEQGNAYL